MPFQITSLEIPDVILAQAKTINDERGFFLEAYKRSELTRGGIRCNFVQDNHSRSRRGVLRGLHFQKQPAAQAKLVWVARGEIFDVAVDIRKGSPTYGQWVGEILSDKNHRLLYIPEGFAHGFVVLSEEADVIYKVSAEYSPEHERGIIWNDPTLRIDWPIEDPLLSPKDAQLPRLENADSNFEYSG
ncbi:MAG TPA: dTDP-4-dehydrorhamnose 3,5-epimerase [Candidatus Acidoferrales bacterium]|nr:dTDP-4-dehydrorhamnose 3,5-epimerase [Candidatus Acidoferrales bacterium]